MTTNGTWVHPAAVGLLLAISAPIAARADEPAPGQPPAEARKFQPLVAPLVRQLPLKVQVHGNDGRDRVLLTVPAEAQKVGKYWIGVGCEPVGETLRSQLDIESGLLVTSVGEQWPAAKAGIEVHDVLLEFGDEKLKEVADLIDAVDASEGKQTTAVLLRRGKQIKIDITPIERPHSPEQAEEQEDEFVWQEFFGPNIDAKALQDRIRRLQPQGPGMRLWRLGPGLIYNQPAADLPEGVTVTVTKEGRKPAAITVKRGEKTWELTEETLDRLPKELAEPVKRYLDRPPVQRPLSALQVLPPPPQGRPAPPQTGAVPPQGGAQPKGPSRPELNLRLREFRLEEGQLQQKMDEMLKQMREMRRQMEREGAFDSLQQELKSLRRDVDRLRKERGDES